MEPLQSVEAVARTLSLSVWTVRAYIRQGKIRPVRIGRRVLIEPCEIVRIIDEGKDSQGCSRDLAAKNTKERARC
jgi:excisionase family DNA binding protein